ncbi:MAG: hypothetical protein K8R53_06020 [Bacteroidales bacterium]|nr:hypothetical protein [Bacteroidales bacterium]
MKRKKQVIEDRRNGLALKKVYRSKNPLVKKLIKTPNYEFYAHYLNASQSTASHFDF